MNRLIIVFTLIFCQYSIKGLAQNSQSDARADINKFRSEKNDYFKDPKTSPLKPESISRFTALDYFPIDLNFRVKAKFKKHDVVKLFYMKTTTDRLPKYGRYGELTFELNGNTYILQAYQSQSLIGTEGYESYLFIPFTDLTSGDLSYGGGRYIDIDIPEGNEVILDFNKTYNPYCAYNSKYSCPVPPRENDMNVEILAGVKNPSDKKH